MNFRSLLGLIVLYLVLTLLTACSSTPLTQEEYERRLAAWQGFSQAIQHTQEQQSQAIDNYIQRQQNYQAPRTTNCQVYNYGTYSQVQCY